MSTKEKDQDKIEWNSKIEIRFLQALQGLKPVGINRFFRMASIHKKFCHAINRQITSKPIWDHLDTLYDMATLHESEVIPFPNDAVDFQLPCDEYNEISIERFGVSLLHLNDENTEVKSKALKNDGFLKPKPIQPSPNPVKSKDLSCINTPPTLKLNKDNFSLKLEPNNHSDGINSKNKIDANAAKVGKGKQTSLGPSKVVKTEPPPLQAKVDLIDAHLKKVVKTELVNPAVKVKQESTFPNKMKLDSNSSIKISKQESGAANKLLKHEANTKSNNSFNKGHISVPVPNIPKLESNSSSKSSPNSGKSSKQDSQSVTKNSKQESNTVTKGTKQDLKKNKNENQRTPPPDNHKKPREVSSAAKKSFVNNDNPGSRRNSKGENVSAKKRADSDAYKKTDVSPVKGKSDSKSGQNNVQSKNNKADDTESLHNYLGTGKTRTQVKNENDASKKRKQTKKDDTPKKGSPAAKRRRI